MDDVEDLERREIAEWAELLATTAWDERAQRWHVEGRPVHAGNELEVRGVRRIDEDLVEPHWFAVRVESEDQGRVLVAMLDHYGCYFRLRLAGFAATMPKVRHPLRWPR